MTLPELAFLAGTTSDIITELVDTDLIVPCAHAPALLFKAETVNTVQRILRLQRQLQIGFDSLALVFELLERIDNLERRIAELEKRQ